ncbi:EboA [Candidatus Phycorickettsia trachydisci]|uniref:EboA n=1 Tax=Candidatus Phycorickettsia trachydisci TaxID=2115978 RepID=A0A2P1P9Y4_9RICK|nr:EboA domain-containing protein [Candidatus Phycorickettsia trachydisci]AVP88081.1 EboA [Candidatus Phycorickettsia trachydisci]
MDTKLFLDSIVRHNLEGYQELSRNLEVLTNPKTYIAFSIAFNNLSKYYTSSPLTDHQLLETEHITGRNTWTNLDLARAYFLLNIADKFKQEHIDIINQLFDTAGLSELISLYKSLHLLPEPTKFLFRATEGVRSNMSSIFKAIALNNTYPMNFFDQDVWNQMILKVFFIEEDINQVIGLRERANDTLADMLSDFVIEKQAAKRRVNPEIWKVVELCKYKTY